MKNRICIVPVVTLSMVWARHGLAATNAVKPGKGVDEATCFSCHEATKELKKWDHF